MYGGGAGSALPFSHLVALHLHQAALLQHEEQEEEEEEELPLLHAGAQLGVGGDVGVGVVDVGGDVDVVVDVGVVVDGDEVVVDGVVVGELVVTEDDDLDAGCAVSLGGWVFLRRSCQLCLLRCQGFSSFFC